AGTPRGRDGPAHRDGDAHRADRDQPRTDAAQAAPRLTASDPGTPRWPDRAGGPPPGESAEHRLQRRPDPTDPLQARRTARGRDAERRAGLRRPPGAEAAGRLPAQDDAPDPPVRRRHGRLLQRRPAIRLAPADARRGRPGSDRRVRVRPGRDTGRPARRRGTDRAPGPPVGADQGDAAGPGGRRRPREHLCRRGPVRRQSPPGAAQQRGHSGPDHRADPDDPLGARPRDRAGRREDHPQQGVPHRRLPASPRPSGRALPGLRHADRQDAGRRPRHVLLPRLPARPTRLGSTARHGLKGGPEGGGLVRRAQRRL
ncbi:MAG: Formamidopyrimidine-DNA glycosylase, partial [uncultured Thermomicrobiales bacterium]